MRRKVAKRSRKKNRKNKEKLVKSLHPVYDGLRSLDDIETDIKKITKLIVGSTLAKKKVKVLGIISIHHILRANIK